MENKFQKYYQQIFDRVKNNEPRYTDRAASIIAQKIIDRWPIELEQNIIEWANNQPLSDIKIYDLSLKDILGAWEKDIPSCVEQNIELALTLLKQYKNIDDEEKPDMRNLILNIHTLKYILW